MTNIPSELTCLVQKISPPSRLVRAWDLAGGISAHMTALEIEDPGGRLRRWIVRRPGAAALQHNPQAARDEFRTLQLVHTLGVAAPTAVYLDPLGEIFSTPCLVIEYIDGQPDFAPANPTAYAQQMAVHLAGLHQADLSTQDPALLPPASQGLGGELDRQPVDAARLTSSENSASDSLDEMRIRQTLQSAHPLPHRNPAALLHGDYWPGNILWREERLVAIVDWEDAQTGDPLQDFAISRLDLLWIYGRKACETFTQVYQSRLAIDYTDLPYWDLFAALRLARLAGPDLAGWSDFFRPFGRPDITPQAIQAQAAFSVAQAYQKLGL